MNLKQRAKEIKYNLPALYLAMKSKETPFIAKLTGGLTLVYALSPIDLIPDFIPVLGYVDDIIILPLFIALTIKLIPNEQFDKYKEEAKELWQDGKPKKWYYAIPFVLVWIFVIYLIIRAIINWYFYYEVDYVKDRWKN